MILGIPPGLIILSRLWNIEFVKKNLRILDNNYSENMGKSVK